MYKKLILINLIIVVLISSPIYGQLVGTYNIGSNGNYPTIGAAVSALDSFGVSGHVTFEIESGIYIEQIEIGAISGTGLNAAITFQSVGMDSSTVIITYPTTAGALNNHVVRFNGASHISFRHLTLSRTGNDARSVVVDISNQSSSIQFFNNRLIGIPSSSAATYQSVVYGFNSHNNSQIQFQRNRIENGSFGIYLVGQGSCCTFQDQGTIVKNNVFVDQFKESIRLFYQNSPQIIQNFIEHNMANSSFKGLNCQYCDKDSRILENKIEFNGGIGMYIHNSANASNQIGLIGNNFVMGEKAGAGIYLNNTKGYHIYHNNVLMSDTNASSSAFKLYGITSIDLRVANNIFSNQAGGYAVFVDTVSHSTPFALSDYNNLHTSGAHLAYYKSNTSIDSLVQWQTITSMDANSFNLDPLFVSNTDLHTQNGFLDKAATTALYAPIVVVDIDGESRGAFPDIGADQFSMDDIAIVDLNFDSIHCRNESDSIRITIQNQGGFLYSGSLKLSFQFDSGNWIIDSIPLTNFAANDSMDFTFSQTVLLDSTGSFSIHAAIQTDTDINPINDSLACIHALNVFDYPMIELGNDTALCSELQITLNANGQAMNYLWSNLSQDSSITVDSLSLGLGNHEIILQASNADCWVSDTVIVSFLDCTSLEDWDQAKCNIYPNPSANLIHIPIEAGDELMQLFDVNGQLLEQLELHAADQNNVMTISVSNLDSGHYHIRVIGDKNIKCARFIKITP